MTALRVPFLAAICFLFSCGTAPTDGTSQTCTTRHECVNGACTCTAGPKNGNSCCDPNSTTCTTAEKCPDFCRYCE